MRLELVWNCREPESSTPGPHRPRQRLPELRTPLPGLLEDRSAPPDPICREEDLLQGGGGEGRGGAGCCGVSACHGKRALLACRLDAYIYRERKPEKRKRERWSGASSLRRSIQDEILRECLMQPCLDSSRHLHTTHALSQTNFFVLSVSLPGAASLASASISKS